MDSFKDICISSLNARLVQCPCQESPVSNIKILYWNIQKKLKRTFVFTFTCTHLHAVGFLLKVIETPTQVSDRHTDQGKGHKALKWSSERREDCWKLHGNMDHADLALNLTVIRLYRLNQNILPMNSYTNTHICTLSFVLLFSAIYRNHYLTTTCPTLTLNLDWT